MQGTHFGALILVTAAAVTACAPRVREANTTPPAAEKLAELWQLPADLPTRDLFHGAGGAAQMPEAGIAYTWVATDTSGYSPGYEVRGPDGRTWDVKLGIEAQS